MAPDLRARKGLRPFLVPASLALLLAGIACQFSPGLQAGSTSHNPPIPQLVATEAGSPPAPTLTPPPTPTPIPLPDLQPTADPRQLALFQELWDTINDDYLYPAYNGQDPDALYQEFYERIQAGLDDESFYLSMAELVERLGDEHSFYLDPQGVIVENAGYLGEHNVVGIGVLVEPVVERQKGVILLTFPGGPAARAGLQGRDSILAIDGQPLLAVGAALRDSLQGPEGSWVILTVQSPGQAPRQVALQREKIAATLQLPYRVLDSPAGLRIGYLLLATFADNSVSDQIRQALREMSAAGPLDGLVLDLRWNRGGTDAMLEGALSYFTSGTVGYFINKDGERPFVIYGRHVSGSQGVPLVVLVGPGTASFGEIFAGILADQGRAFLIGERTSANVEVLWGYNFSDGSRLWMAHDTFRPQVHPDQNWELVGVQPDLYLFAEWENFTLEDDPLVRAAMGFFESR